MTQFRLDQRDCKSTLARLQAIMKSSSWSNHPAADALQRETVALIEGRH
jgi:hypothetical protein